MRLFNKTKNDSTTAHKTAKKNAASAQRAKSATCGFGMLESLESRQMYSAVPANVTSAFATEYLATQHETDAYNHAVSSLIGSAKSVQSLPTIANSYTETFSSDSATMIFNPGWASAHVVAGGIGAEWNALGHETDAYGRNAQTILGAPVNDEQNMPGFSGARYQVFDHGTIYWSAATGAHAVFGAIGGEYYNTAYQTDANGTITQHVLGLPTSDEMNVPGLSGARMQTFQGGTIYWSNSTGAYAVYGGIGGEYNKLGGALSKLGLPTSDEESYSTGRTQSFKNGFVIWSPNGSEAYLNTNGAITVLAYF